MPPFHSVEPKKFEVSPFKLIGSDWLLITARKGDKVNTMTASWGGLGVMWGKNVAYAVIRPQRYTKEFVDEADTFSLTFFDASFKKTLGYLGTVSGRYEDKIANSGLTLTDCEGTPFFEEAHTALICRKLFTQQYGEQNFLDTSITGRWYPEKDFHFLFIAEIEHILVRD